MNTQNNHDLYVIPPNFVDTGTVLGGMFRVRNVIEAGILAAGAGLPVLMFLPFSLTARIIVLCLTALPLSLVALIGVSGESLTEFLMIFLKFLKNRRVIGGEEAKQTSTKTQTDDRRSGKHLFQKKETVKASQSPLSDRSRSDNGSRPYQKARSRRFGEEDFPAEFDEVKGYELKE